MSKSQVQLRVLASNDHLSARENLARAFRNSMTEHLRAHTEDTNVNPQTLLTTDYLNHFNEIIMLLELVPSAPSQFTAELAGWEHESYEEHFTHSGFRDKELAIAGYRNAPEDVRRAFDLSIADLEKEMVMVLQKLQEKIGCGDTEAVNNLCSETIPRLQELLRISAGIVNGGVPSCTDDSADAAAKSEAKNAQSEVDAIFD
ncbi:MAG: hypothetical protein P8Z76_20170 [Alphaproteobacteria bacterium]|jgi:hypothetical protein